MAILNKDEILAADDLEMTEVDVTKWWGGSVYLRSMTGREREQVETRMVQSETQRDYKDIRAFTLVRTLCNAQRGNLFTENEIAALSGKNSEVLEFLFNKALDLSGFGDRSIEDAKKNSTLSPPLNSGTSSPSPSEAAPSLNSSAV